MANGAGVPLGEIRHKCSHHVVRLRVRVLPLLFGEFLADRDLLFLRSADGSRAALQSP
jgi:hypothetical protein